MQQPVDILRQYWKHDSFRHPQQEIIDSVLAGTDTFALMPTGGGKSICFQVPALAKDGICLVISPLVALMKDQVANLQSRGIKALSLTGGLSVDETSDLLDNCRFGNFKFLYLSPERLQSEWIVDRLKSLPVNLVAVDEAHCISQWGHDFRPAYLKIELLKAHFPKVPFIALTASATPRVQADVIKQLGLGNPRIFTASFERKNLAYFVTHAEDKHYRIQQIMAKTPGPSIIYVRNRKACIDVSEQLKALGISATFYHGGLPAAEKDRNMRLWMEEKARVIVATNAFGMGIDKANVRSVIHIQLPENLENYYQEAGRAGRDGEKSFAILIVSPSDIATAKNQFLSVLPDKDFLKSAYVKLCNYFQIAYGEAPDDEQPFNLGHFCQQYNFPAAKAYNALQFLDRQGVISLSQEFSEKMALQFIVPSKEVIRYMSLNPADEQVILTLLRTYPGIYEMKLAINPTLIAKKSGSDTNTVSAVLRRLDALQMADLVVKGNDSAISFNEVREDDHTINRISKYLQEQNNRKKEQLQTVIDYVGNETDCRSAIISGYFGEPQVVKCGICSNCIGKPKEKPEKKLSVTIVELLGNGRLTSREIQDLAETSETALIFALRELLEDEVIKLGPDNRYQLLK